jgi:hypothetical protein
MVLRFDPKGIKMNKPNKDTVYLYCDNCECFGEIDRETLTREWNYFSQFPSILGPYNDKEKMAQQQSLKTAPVSTFKLV